MHRVLTWFARALGSVFTFLFASGWVGGRIPELLRSSGVDTSVFLLFCLPVFVGFAVAWFHPYRGGWVMVFGSMLVAGFLMVSGRPELALIHGLPPLVVGGAFLESSGRGII